MNWFGVTGGGVLALLGLAHLFYTLRDLAGSPRVFSPRDDTLLSAMQQTTVRLSPKGRDYWQALLGFHVSHSLAVLMASGLVMAGASPAGPWWLATAGLAITLIYAFLSWRFWFSIPLYGCLISVALQVAGLLLT